MRRRRPGRRADHPANELRVPAESALLVPAPEAEALVGAWRNRLDPSAGQGIPAHVTVLFPFAPPSELNGQIEARLAALFAAFAPFPYRLERIDRFPGVLYLAPDPPEPFVALTDAVHREWPQHPPYGGAFDEVVPHLTVGDWAASRVERGREAAMATVERDIVQGVPIDAVAREVWLMVGPDPWTVRTTFRLGG